MNREHMVFVYGTLRQGCANHHLLKDAYCYGVGSTLSKFAMYLVSGFPYVTSSESRYQIVGELYAVDKITLAELDKMEGHPIHYERSETVVEVNGEQYSAWMYFRNPQGKLLQNGDFKETKAARSNPPLAGQ